MKAPQECASIEDIRFAIDTLDHEILELLGKRFQYVKAITHFKKTADDVRAPVRRAQVLQQRRIWAAEQGINPDVIEQMYSLLIDYFISAEMQEMGIVIATSSPEPTVAEPTVIEPTVTGATAGKPGTVESGGDSSKHP
jgi:isochorismate pyruvate lyase